MNLKRNNGRKITRSEGVARTRSGCVTHSGGRASRVDLLEGRVDILGAVEYAEKLNMHFSSVFTREDSSSLPVPETKFKGSEGGKVGAVNCNPRSSS